MKKFLTFVFLLLGISFLGTDPVQAYCSSPGPNAAEGSWGGYKNCVERERRQLERKIQLERMRQEQMLRDQQRRYEEQRRIENYQIRKGLPPGGIQGRIQSVNP